jgi:outer membrane protein insertion porin family
MKNTKDRNTLAGAFKGARYLETKFAEDKRSIIATYQDMGYRDAKITFDTIYTTTGVGYYMPVSNVFKIEMNIDEGRRYYFRNINYSGNTLYPDTILNKVLSLKKGDIYNQTQLNTRLFADPAGQDITTLYMDDGYLFFSVTPIETVENDSIDLEIRIREGAQATISSVSLIGNDRTSDHVVIRELRTRPGQKFNRSDIIRTTRELSQLGYFDPAQIDVVPTPNPNTGTVDIEYKVVERSNDQIELQGGWGPNASGKGTLVGSLGLTLNNFSAKRIFDKKSWQPLPSGDGQRLSLRAQANGFFQSYNASFTEPWLGGKRPNAFTVGVFSSKQDYSSFLTTGTRTAQSIITRGASISLSRRLKFPDDFFVISHGISYQRYDLNNFPSSPFIQTGTVNNVFITETISRNSIDQPIFPKRGAQMTLTAQFAPPFSLLSTVDKTKLPVAQQYKWLEYHKWRFDASWYTKLSTNGKFVLLTKAQFGFLGKYNNGMGEIPFGRFFLGGDGLAGFNIDDREIIGLRGYKSQTGNGDQALTPRDIDQTGQQGQFVGGTAFQKYTLEARYLLVPNPSSTIYLTAFLEGGNNVRNIKDFDPFKNYRSAGVGGRIFLPMFGLIGVDWGYGFNGVQGLKGANGSQIHVSIGQQF